MYFLVFDFESAAYNYQSYTFLKYLIPVTFLSLVVWFYTMRDKIVKNGLNPRILYFLWFSILWQVTPTVKVKLPNPS